jgi:phage replication O-like protein O
MANPQLENGKTEIANELLEAMIRTHFSPSEMTIILVILRKTFGWHKKSDRISFTQFEEATGMDRWHIAPALKHLVERHIITRSGTGYSLEYSIQKDYESWQSLPKSVTSIITEISNETKPATDIIVTKNSNEIITDSSNEVVTKNSNDSVKPSPKIITDSVEIVTKNSNEIITCLRETQKQESNNKRTGGTETPDEKFVLPDWIKPDVWKGFVEMRVRIKKPLTDRAKNLVIAELLKWQNIDKDNEPNAVLNQSVMNSWQGVFELTEVKDKRAIRNRQKTINSGFSQQRQQSPSQPKNHYVVVN